MDDEEIIGSDVADWLAELPRRMQSTTLMSLRGPDTDWYPNIKTLVKMIRQVCLKPDEDPNDPNDDYMQPATLDYDALLKELEYCTVHYAMHLLHACEIIGYMHPNRNAAVDFWVVYQSMVGDWHLRIETKQELCYRLRPRSGRLLHH